MLDGLIDASAFAPAPAVDELVRDFSRSERDGEDYQLLLDRVRRRVNERRFALGVQLIVAHSDPIEAAEGYSRVAEAAINVLADAADRRVRGAARPGRRLGAARSSASGGSAARR